MRYGSLQLGPYLNGWTSMCRVGKTRSPPEMILSVKARIVNDCNVLGYASIRLGQRLARAGNDKAQVFHAALDQGVQSLDDHPDQQNAQQEIHYVHNVPPANILGPDREIFKKQDGWAIRLTVPGGGAMFCTHFIYLLKRTLLWWRLKRTMCPYGVTPGARFSGKKYATLVEKECGYLR